MDIFCITTFRIYAAGQAQTDTAGIESSGSRDGFYADDRAVIITTYSVKLNFLHSQTTTKIHKLLTIGLLTIFLIFESKYHSSI